MQWLALTALTVYLAAHVSLAVGLARIGRWRDALLALFLPPLAPWWGWSAGMRRRTLAWTVGLVVYACVVAAA